MTLEERNSRNLRVGISISMFSMFQFARHVLWLVEDRLDESLDRQATDGRGVRSHRNTKHQKLAKLVLLHVRFFFWPTTTLDRWSSPQPKTSASIHTPHGSLAAVRRRSVPHQRVVKMDQAPFATPHHPNCVFLFCEFVQMHVVSGVGTNMIAAKQETALSIRTQR